jgi:hypothetical protein
MTPAAKPAMAASNELLRLDLMEKSGALRELARIRSPAQQVEPELVGLLGDPDLHVRRDAAVALESIDPLRYRGWAAPYQAAVRGAQGSLDRSRAGGAPATPRAGRAIEPTADEVAVMAEILRAFSDHRRAFYDRMGGTNVVLFVAVGAAARQDPPQLLLAGLEGPRRPRPISGSFLDNFMDIGGFEMGTVRDRVTGARGDVLWINFARVDGDRAIARYEEYAVLNGNGHNVRWCSLRRVSGRWRVATEWQMYMR